jgi:Mat/Ecp fimbriae major subunit
MTSKMFKAALAATVVAVASFGATSAHAADATASAKATILAAVTIASDGSDLSFGTIAPGSAAANIVVSNAGVRGACPVAYVCTGTTTAAGFNLTGANSTVVKITLPTSVSLSAGSDTMTATLTSDATAGLLTLSAAGAGTLKVGGTLQVGAAQAAGNYVGSFTVSAVYN